MNEKLKGGDQFPSLTLQVGDGHLQLPTLGESTYSIILFYRGHW